MGSVNEQQQVKSESINLNEFVEGSSEDNNVNEIA
jgi:hypothetical protein